jgi:glycerol-3-phosphate acyltransferase PlsY
VALLASLVVFVGVVAWTRYISLGSIIAAGCFPLAVWIVVQPAWQVEAAAIIAGAFIVYKHSSNIERLRAGTEHVFTFGAHKH